MDPGISQSTSSTKVERRVIEKNRRTQMKILYSELNSLLPNQNSKEITQLPLPAQIDEAIKYIKSLEAKVNRSEEKKDSLLGKRKSYFTTTNSTNHFESSSSSSCGSHYKPPQIKIRETGSALEVVLTTGLDSRFLFHEIIQIFHEERVDIIHASFSVIGDSVFHIVHGEIGDCMFDFGGTKITERLKRLVNAPSSDVEQQPPAAASWWDHLADIQPEL